MNVGNVVNNDRLFMTASNDGTIKIWDIDNYQHLATLESRD